MNNYFSYRDELIFVHYLHDAKPEKENFTLHTHGYCEVYCFFGGKGRFIVEGNSYPLHSGDILIMRPGEAHYIDIDLSVPYTRLAVHFYADLFDKFDSSRQLLRPFFQRERGRLNFYDFSDFGNDSYKQFINNICNPAENRRLNTITNLLMLLYETASAFDRKDRTESENPLIQKILGYINNNLSCSISLEDICSKFYISKAQLCRLFRASTGSTVWEYVTAKRLLMAQGLIRAGKKPTKIYQDCGFSDYTVFFRAYKKRYGKSPNDISYDGKI